MIGPGIILKWKHSEVIYKNIAMKNIFILSISLVCLFTISSCKKENKTQIKKDDELIGLTVSLGGVYDLLVDDKLSTVANSKGENTLISDYEITSYADFDAIITQETLRANNLNNRPFSRIDKNKIAVTSPMQRDVRYFLLLYQNNNGSPGEFVRGELLKAGESKTLYVEAGKSYYWIAYSYNSTEDNLPQITSATASTTIPMGQNIDFLYAKGVSPTVNPNNPTYLTIVFDHMLARIGVELNTKGMFADINSAEIELVDNYLETQDFNILTGQVVAGTTTSYGKNQKATQFENLPSLSDNDRKIAYFYTSRTSKIPNFKFRLNKLEIKLDAEASALGNSNRVFTYSSNQPEFSSSNITPVIRSTKVLKIDLVESPIAVTTGAEYRLVLGLIGIPMPDITVKWARANLYYHPSDQSYRFQHANVPTTNRNSYFPYGSASPTSYSKDQDPCKLVYPENLWRTASSQDYYALIGGTVNDVNLLNILKVNLNLLGLSIASIKFDGIGSSNKNKTATFFEYKSPQSANPFYYIDNTTNGKDMNNKIRFNFNGYYLNVGLVQNIIDLNLGDVNNEARLWTNSSNLGLAGIVNTGAIGYTATKDLDKADISLLNLLDIDLLGLQVIRSNLYNVRCVRNE